MANYIRDIELLAPAKDAATAIEAINCGADAVYIGASKYGARYSASNSVDDIRRVVDYAHLFNAKVYVTINTIIRDDELEDVRLLICELYAIGVDALIVQDMAILMMNIPPIALHASTQCDISSVEKAKFLESVGFSQLVLARELSLEQIKAISQSVNVPVEVFVHGALCVSYSGKCHASQALMGRSANRGACAQICRLPYDLLDGDNNLIESKKHLLSLRDLNQLDKLADLLSAGVSSFKIEGRLKDVGYVKNVVAAYRRALDKIISLNPDKYRRSSVGNSILSFTPDLRKTFNRSYTHYFLDTRDLDKLRIANHLTPKSMGEKIGTVKAVKDKEVAIATTFDLHNGDGLSYFNKNGEYEGVRVNNVLTHGRFLTLSKSSIPTGAVLYRTYDKNFSDALLQPSKRVIGVRWVLNDTSLIAIDDLGNKFTYEFPDKFEDSKSDQRDRQITTLSKLGDTHFEAQAFEINTHKFIPASDLAEARRQSVAGLTAVQLKKTFESTRDKRILSSNNSNGLYASKTVSFRENVMNSLARKFYLEHGASSVEDALEAVVPEINNEKGLQVMTTRYCLRRELGACKKTPDGKKLKEPLTLRSSDGRILTLNFDCTNCQMQVYCKHK